MKLNREILKGSFILLVAFNAFNLLNFIFQFVMARIMTPSEYGTLAALFSIIYIFGIFSESIQTTMTKFSSSEGDIGKINNIFIRMKSKAVVASLSLFFIYLIISVFLSKILDIPYLLLAITGFIIITSFITPISRGIMQGKKMFRKLGLNLLIEASVKLVLATILVLMGWKVYGAMVAIIISTFISLSLSFYQIKKIIDSKEKNFKIKGAYFQTALIFIVTLGVTAFYNIDILIAKAIFTPEIAGFYAISSILAKIIFLGTAPVSKAMLPIASDGKKQDSGKIFLNALLILSVLVTFSLLIFYCYPNLVVQIFSGKYLPESMAILFRMGIAISILSYSNLILLYHISSLSIETIGRKTQVLVLKGIFLLSLILAEAIILANSSSLDNFVNRLILSSIIFLIGSLIVLVVKK